MTIASRHFSLHVSWVFAALAGGAACSEREPEATGSSDRPVVYGNDDRQDVYAFGDPDWAAQAAGFAAALMPLDTIDLSDPDDVRLPAETLADSGICPDERFADQLVAGSCSGTLIAPDLLLTAGHCIDDGRCAGIAFVFDYSMTDPTSLQTITADDVYRCSDVLVNQADDSDYAVVRLDRAVVGRTPAIVRDTDAPLAPGLPLLVNGFPSGLPLKIDDGGDVREERAAARDYFVANLDTFGGNSGSGVFDAATRQLVGILVRGDNDYVPDPAADCDRVNVCPDDGCRGEDSTYAFRAIEALCASGEAAPLWCACGDGICDADDGESTVTCAPDCGTSCGDGTCNGGEDSDACPDDCPPPPAGETCERPFAIALQDTQTITGDTSDAQDDLSGSCLGGSSPDHVYAFTLHGEATVDVVVGGYDTGLHLRSACTDEASELACHDDIDFPDNPGSRITAPLAAGDYFLVVDGYNGSAGAYTLTVGVDCTDPSDSDGDQAASCVDGCPADPGKTEPGVCGCGVADHDADGDGHVDCDDPCPDAADCHGSDDGGDDGHDDGHDEGHDGECERLAPRLR